LALVLNILDFVAAALCSVIFCLIAHSISNADMPLNAGISMTVEQWEAFRNSLPAIEDAIKNLEE
jgi:hypothetical protein